MGPGHLEMSQSGALCLHLSIEGPWEGREGDSLLPALAEWTCVSQHLKRPSTGYGQKRGGGNFDTFGQFLCLPPHPIPETYMQGFLCFSIFKI